mmetsp:Transcript_1765/g.4453  ORF Transcript_1765/g.4453 Transcript_1765/m.4453 type:complete len:181 (+) Transcript_1765:100-642(+)|eukprot:CAMPEP_0202343404 /NCGR_PEP_ID=MMETSP1126-20121109/3538_1 /ASSEMBLY_ACC=CAM_ASM_000457 /TAXON_ID=3047 /ORGANISM="Dunaliella tertiolecta, Strain CCMP1320" /LENGTH=180 /DNA_ID=CAMNT_0048934465 /DNA_START=101 /DNA_END=643 /DNA_ORIENTATION=-
MVLSKVHSEGLQDIEGKRHVVIALDLSDNSWRATKYYADELSKPGDVVHLVHISRCLEPQVSVQHSYPGASYNVPELHRFDERQHSEHIQGVIKSRFLPCLEGLGIQHILHLYFDTDNSPGTAIAAILNRVAEEVKASLMVMAAHNKAYGLTEFLIGSVAEECTQHSKFPVVVVRNWGNV